MLAFKTKIKISYIISAGILFGFIFNAPVQYYIPSTRIIFISFTLFGLLYLIYKDYKYSINKEVYFLFYLLIIFSLITVNISEEPFGIVLRNMSMPTSLLLGYLAYRNYDSFIKVLKILIYINFFVMIYEIVSLKYLFDLGLGGIYQIDRVKGLFSYSKEAGSFLLMASLLFRKNNFLILIILLLSSIMTGSRTPVLFISVLLIIEYIYYIKKNNINIKQITRFIIFISIVLILLNIYFTTHESMYGRLLNSFNMSEGGHSMRIHVWLSYIRELNNFDILHLLFGNTVHINHVIGNGAENSYLELISNNGLLVSMCILFLFLFFAFLAITVNFFEFYPFLLLLLIFQFGRYIGGWSGGIILFMYLFQTMGSIYFHSILKRVYKGKLCP
jgi:hypothetical protein